PLSTAFFTASDLEDRNPSNSSETLNLLINKEFIVSAAPEVGRIIDTTDLPSTPNSKNRHNSTYKRSSL
ncbi:hypothetical protein, partial [Pseudomonas sp. CFBP 13719]|uniref:hypothetical protein n=1 Tax=Pseudomonas sp. CFBP 13719 TaxID=2775303 RepID=UPI001A916D31